MMHVIVRPWTAAGATLIVAGAVAVSPVAAPVAAPPTVVIPAIELAALPLPAWLQWINTGTTALGAQFGAIAAGVQNELQHPVPIITAMARNQVINVQNIAGAAINSVQSLSVVPIVSAVTTLGTNTAARAVGVFNAVVAGVGPITGALLNIPVAIFNAVVASALGVLGSITTLNPLNVVGALGDGLVNVETAAFNAAAAVVTAVGNLRQSVDAAVSYPLPATASVAPRALSYAPAAAASAAPARNRTARAASAPRAAVSAPRPAASAPRPAASAKATNTVKPGAKAAAARPSRR